MLTQAVGLALEEIRVSFAGRDLAIEPDGQGGAYVTIADVDFGARFVPRSGWIGFHVGMHYPAADVYPHYAPPLARANGASLPTGLSCSDGVTWRGKPAAQISRRSNSRRADADTAAIKLTKVLQWLRSL